MLGHRMRPGVITLFLTVLASFLTACFMGRGPIKPAITIVSPLNGEQIILDQEIGVTSLALDDLGIDRVELWVDGRLVRTDSANSGTEERSIEMVQMWRPTSAGRHTITVKAYSRSGLSSNPSTVLVQVVPALHP